MSGQLSSAMTAGYFNRSLDACQYFFSLSSLTNAMRLVCKVSKVYIQFFFNTVTRIFFLKIQVIINSCKLRFFELEFM